MTTARTSAHLISLPVPFESLRLEDTFETLTYIPPAGARKRSCPWTGRKSDNDKSQARIETGTEPHDDTVARGVVTSDHRDLLRPGRLLLLFHVQFHMHVPVFGRQGVDIDGDFFIDC